MKARPAPGIASQLAAASNNTLLPCSSCPTLLDSLDCLTVHAPKLLAKSCHAFVRGWITIVGTFGQCPKCRQGGPEGPLLSPGAAGGCVAITVYTDRQTDTETLLVASVTSGDPEQGWGTAVAND